MGYMGDDGCWYDTNNEMVKANVKFHQQQKQNKLLEEQNKLIQE